MFIFRRSPWRDSSEERAESATAKYPEHYNYEHERKSKELELI